MQLFRPILLAKVCKEITKIQEGSISLHFKFLIKKELTHRPESATCSLHTSLTLSKHKPQHQSGPWQYLVQNLSCQKPRVELKRVVFFMTSVFDTNIMLQYSCSNDQ